MKELVKFYLFVFMVLLVLAFIVTMIMETTLEGNRFEALAYSENYRIMHTLVLFLAGCCISTLIIFGLFYSEGRRKKGNKHDCEAVESNYGYLSGYSNPKTIIEQMFLLQEIAKNNPGLFLVKDLFVDERSIGQSLPKNAEGFFIVPKWQIVASNYNEAVQKMLKVLRTEVAGRFVNYRENELGPEYLRQSERTRRMWEEIGKKQTGNLLIFSAQFGLYHRGESVRRVRSNFEDSEDSLEFGLDLYTVIVMLLLNSCRLAQRDDLWIDCPGTEYTSDDEENPRYSVAPYFRFRAGKIGLDVRWIGRYDDGYGSATGFIVKK